MNLWNSTSGVDGLGRLHPLVKIAILVSTAVFAFLVSRIEVLAVFFFMILVLIRRWKIRFGRVSIIFRAFAISLPMLYALFIFSFLWKQPTAREGLLLGIAEGTRYALRFLSLILINFAVVLSTDPREIIQALRMLRLPDVLCQILAHVISLMPRLLQELQDIVEAQTARGMQWKNLWRPSSWLPLALPAVLAVMRYSEQTAISLELRGGAICPAERAKPFRYPDFIVSVLCITLVITGITLRN